MEKLFSSLWPGHKARCMLAVTIICKLHVANVQFSVHGCRYGNQQLIRYRVQCQDNHFAFFDLTFLDLEPAGCSDDNFPGQLR